jgi:GSH-dependent disulfide-bond oxidoreductase
LGRKWHLAHQIVPKIRFHASIQVFAFCQAYAAAKSNLPIIYRRTVEPNIILLKMWPIYTNALDTLVNVYPEIKFMNDTTGYTPPKVWKWDAESGGRFANINRPFAGATHDKDLPVGKHPLQLYSLATPNGVKVTILLEELLAAGHAGAEYDAWVIDIMEGDQFGSGFVHINPNSKIPALVDQSGKTPVNVFESGSILLYLAEKFGAFIPTDPIKRTECLSWLFWQMGSAPYLGGGFGHFYAYAPEKFEYSIDRFTMEAKRQMDVLDRHLADNQFMTGDEYTIADIAIWPWYAGVALNRVYEAAEFLEAEKYTHLMRWANQIDARKAVSRGRMVNCTWGDDKYQLHERHDASDFETRTQDKLKP